MISLFKKTKYFLLAATTALVVISASGCEDALQEKVYSQVPTNDFYKTLDQAQLALNGVYTYLWNDNYRDGQWVTLGDVTAFTLIGGGSANGSGDRSGIQNEWNTFSWTPDANELVTAWDYFYQVINRSNTLIDKMEAAEFQGKDKILGEAKFLRALFYFNLVRIFGGVPLHVHATTDLSETEKPRSTEAEVYTQIVSDLQSSVELLSPLNKADLTAGKATAISASSLLAKVYLQQRNWKQAAEEAKKVMDQGVFDLFADYENINNPDFQNGKEHIFSIQHGGNANSTSQFYQTRMIYLFGPPAQTVKGVNVQFHALKDLVIFQAKKSFFTESPDTYRKWQSVRDKMPYYYKNGIKELVRDTVTMYAPFLTKFHRVDFATGFLKEGVNYPLIRYSDILLTYAEAINETDGPTAPALEALNKVRRRARAVGTAFEQDAKVYPDLGGLTKDGFRDALLKERAQEFVGEGHYRWDLIRHNRLISNAKANGVTAAAEKHNLFPIPTQQISRNNKIEQNPGY
ncbi:RagB/SusD family nutrient uptake outer membrane protein [Dyadobacter sp. NIV53]|uniref:RagB/SusD family nutrient uptake outer membrane protein n=1 Tax=Dyadobacter sp. NIV53 TaxID=2861765 RepID=UPI001C878B1B|nr:RagB/SusD family nutrient uptake outer membrane protein [Dyadobacter sp. NIV53]